MLKENGYPKRVAKGRSDHFDTGPSWGYLLSKGAATVWEHWDCDTRDLGMNSEALLIKPAI